MLTFFLILCLSLVEPTTTIKMKEVQCIGAPMTISLDVANEGDLGFTSIMVFGFNADDEPLDTGFGDWWIDIPFAVWMPVFDVDGEITCEIGLDKELVGLKMYGQVMTYVPHVGPHVSNLDCTEFINLD